VEKEYRILVMPTLVLLGKRIMKKEDNTVFSLPGRFESLLKEG